MVCVQPVNLKSDDRDCVVFYTVHTLHLRGLVPHTSTAHTKVENPHFNLARHVLAAANTLNINMLLTTNSFSARHLNA